MSLTRSGRLVAVLLLSVFAAPVGAQTLIVVRHAEKAGDGSLRPEGENRARELGRLLRGAHVGNIYYDNSGPAEANKRMPQTANLACEAMKGTPRPKPKTLEELKSLPAHLTAGDCVLIVLHSTDISDFLASYTDLPAGERKVDEKEYDHLFILTADHSPTTRGKFVCIHLRYNSPPEDK